MASYCTITEVQALNPRRIYDANSTPTTTQVNALIDQIAVEIDAVLQAKGYTVPVTTPANFLNALKYVNAYGAGALAEAGMFPEVSEMGQTPHWKVLNDKYKDWMKQLRAGEIPRSLGIDSESIGAGSNYTEMTDQDDFPDPAFRIRTEDKDF